MSGQAAVRGFLLQTMVCLLNALSEKISWNTVSLEPNLESQKVDILWQLGNQKTKVVQVKSSQNQINLNDAKKWAIELKTSHQADEYELILIGPCAAAVVELRSHDGVCIPTPKGIDLEGFVSQISHKLDIFLEERGVSKIPALAREILVSSLITKLEAFSTTGSPLDKRDLEKTLFDWILVLYPRALNNFLEMQVDVLCDTIIFASLTGPSHNSFALLLPMTFVNCGVRTAIIEWLAIRVIDEKKSLKLYSPIGLIDYQKFIQERRSLHAENSLGHFTEFSVLPGSEKNFCVLFSQEEKNESFPFNVWVLGQHKFDIILKLRDKKFPCVVKSIFWNVTQKIADDYKQGSSAVCSVRDIAIENLLV